MHEGVAVAATVDGLECLQEAPRSAGPARVRHVAHEHVRAGALERKHLVDDAAALHGRQRLSTPGRAQERALARAVEAREDDCVLLAAHSRPHVRVHSPPRRAGMVNE